MVFMITYDLNKSGKDYSDVFEAIKNASTGAWCHCWDSSWLIKSDYTSANDVANLITPYMDSNDTLFVVEAEKNYQGLLTEKNWNYIRENIFN